METETSCSICYEQINDKNYLCMKCNNIYCLKCLYISISNKNYIICCPNCNNIIPLKTFYNLYDKYYINDYYKNISDIYIINNKNKILESKFENNNVKNITNYQICNFINNVDRKSLYDAILLFDLYIEALIKVYQFIIKKYTKNIFKITDKKIIYIFDKYENKIKDIIDKSFILHNNEILDVDEYFLINDNIYRNINLFYYSGFYLLNNSLSSKEDVDINIFRYLSKNVNNKIAHIKLSILLCKYNLLSGNIASTLNYKIINNIDYLVKIIASKIDKNFDILEFLYCGYNIIEKIDKIMPGYLKYEFISNSNFMNIDDYSELVVNEISKYNNLIINVNNLKKYNIENLFNICAIKNTISYYYLNLKNHEEIKKNIINKCVECDVGKIEKIIEKNNFYSYKCSLCTANYCTSCCELLKKDVKHICIDENIKSFNYIINNSCSCPGCGIRINKINGCDVMFCTICHISFSYTTGKILTNNLHNPHRIEWLKSLKTKLNGPGFEENVNGLCVDVLAEGYFNLNNPERSIVLNYVSFLNSFIDEIQTKERKIEQDNIDNVILSCFNKKINTQSFKNMYKFLDMKELYNTFIDSSKDILQLISQCRISDGKILKENIINLKKILDYFEEEIINNSIIIEDNFNIKIKSNKYAEKFRYELDALYSNEKNNYKNDTVTKRELEDHILNFIINNNIFNRKIIKYDISKFMPNLHNGNPFIDYRIIFNNNLYYFAPNVILSYIYTEIKTNFNSNKHYFNFNNDNIYNIMNTYDYNNINLNEIFKIRFNFGDSTKYTMDYIMFIKNFKFYDNIEEYDDYDYTNNFIIMSNYYNYIELNKINKSYLLELIYNSLNNFNLEIKCLSKNMKNYIDYNKIKNSLETCIDKNKENESIELLFKDNNKELAYIFTDKIFYLDEKYLSFNFNKIIEFLIFHILKIYKKINNKSDLNIDKNIIYNIDDIIYSFKISGIDTLNFNNFINMLLIHISGFIESETIY